MMNQLTRYFILALFLCLSSPLQARIQAIWSTGVAVPGEQVYLYLVDEDCGDDPFTFTKEPSIKGASVKVMPYRVGTNPMNSDNKIMEIYPLLIIPDASGELVVGTLEVQYKSGRSDRVQVPNLPVASTSEIKWYNKPAPYGALWYQSKKDPYIDETIQASIKLFLPQQCIAPGLPSFQSAGVKISPFNASVSGIIALIHRELKPQSTAFASGKTWITQDFKGELTPFSEKGAEISGTIYIEQRDGIFLLGKAELPLPSLSIKPLPLPPGEPADFDKLVGEFSISTSTEAKSLSMNEAVDVEIRVMGLGSLSQHSIPQAMDAEAWKLIPATSKPILNANGERIGMIYHQLLRPVQEVSGIPAFKLSYFDPEKQQYEQCMSKPIPLKWVQSDEAGGGLQYAQGASEPPPAGTVPVAEMSDIYGNLPEEVSGEYSRIPLWVYGLLYLPALGILLGVAIKAWLRYRHASAGSRAQEKELASIAQAADALSFLKAAGAFAEKNLNDAALAQEGIRAILKQRDEEAFRPNASSSLSKEQRKSILQELRRAISRTSVLLVLLIAGLSITNSQGATPSELDQAGAKAYAGGQFSEAAKSYEQAISQVTAEPSSRGGTSLARLYYQLGNAQYRLGEEGKAALSYARALQAKPNLKEARANLGFIQRKQGAILPAESKASTIFTSLSVPQLRVASIVASALLLLCISLMVARTQKQRTEQNLRRKKSSVGLKLSFAASIILCLLCGANWLYYESLETPDLSALPASQIAYVTKATTARSAADVEGAPIMSLPASTPLIIIAHRPSWDYVECLNGTRAWIENANCEIVEPAPSK